MFLRAFLRVFVTTVLLLPILPGLSWMASCTLPLVEDAEAAEFFESQDQRHLGWNGSQDHKSDALVEQQLSLPARITINNRIDDFDLGDSTNKVFDDGGTRSLLWEFHRELEFSPKVKSRIDIIRKEILPSKNTFSQPPRNSDEFSHRNLVQIISIKNESDNLSLGAKYYYVGEGVEDLEDLVSDQQGTDIWGEIRFGPARFESSLSRFWDNLDRDRNRFRTLTTRGDIGVGYKVPTLPLDFFFSYSQSTSESTMVPGGSKPQSSEEETFYGSLYYHESDIFEVTVSSSYSSTEDQIHSSDDTEFFLHEISASIWPFWNMTIAPTLSYSEYRDRDYGGRTETPSGSLSLTCSQLFNAVDLSLWGQYSLTKSTDGSQDLRAIYTMLEIGWNAKYRFLPEARFAFEFGYDKYVDKIYHDSSYDAFSTSFALEFPF